MRDGDRLNTDVDMERHGGGRVKTENRLTFASIIVAYPFPFMQNRASVYKPVARSCPLW